MLYNIFLHAHSGLRWVVLLLIALAIVNAILKYRNKTLSTCRDCAFNRLALISVHLQLVVGLVLYFISPKVIFSAASMKVSLLRFFLVEHVALMVIAVILITIGYVKSERSSDDAGKYRKIFIYYSIALLLILISIPWPFRGFGSGWF